MMRTLVATVMAVGCATTTAAGAAPAAAAHGRPVFRTAPTSPPATSWRHHACSVSGGNPPASGDNRGHGLVWVRRHATGVVMVWLPGLDDRHCRAKETTGSRRSADWLAGTIRHAKRVPRGVFECPLSDGTQVRVYFTFAHGRDEYADVPLSGCRFVNAPHRLGRFESNAMDKVLRAAAPRRWKRYFSG